MVRRVLGCIRWFLYGSHPSPTDAARAAGPGRSFPAPGACSCVAPSFAPELRKIYTPLTVYRTDYYKTDRDSIMVRRTKTH